MTKRQYVEWLNELGVPAEDCKSEGGRIPDGAHYGAWLRRNDPIAFEVGWQEWKRNHDWLARQAKTKGVSEQ